MDHRRKGLAVRYAQWVIRWRWLVLIASIAAVFAAAAGAPRLGFTNDYQVFFSDENPELNAFQALENVYTKTDTILIAVKPKDDSEKVFTPDTLEVIKGLTEESWKVPFAIRVDSLTNFQHTEAIGDDLTVADLVVDPAGMDAAALKKAEEVAVSEPALVNRLVAADGYTAGVLITLHMPGEDPMEVTQAVSHAEELVGAVRTANPDLNFAIAGIAPLSNSFPVASQTDMETLIPLMWLVLFVSMIVLLRVVTGKIGSSVLASVVMTLTVIMSAAVAMGMAGWGGIKLTPPSATAPNIILTIAIADCIHILITMYSQMRRGMNKHDALVESLRVNVSPVFLTSLTTVIGFMSLNFSDSPPFADLGNISAVGVAAAWALSMTLLPALMAILPAWVAPAVEGKMTAMDRFGDFVVNQRRKLLLSTTVIILAILAFIPTIELDDRFIEYFDHSYQIRVDTEFVTDNLTGPDILEMSVPSAGEGGISEPEYLRNLEMFANWFRTQPGVMHVNSFTDVMKRLNKSMHGDDESWYRLPNDRELAAQYLLLYELSLPYGLDLNSQINIDKSATRLSVTMESLSTTEMRALKERSEQWLVDNAPEYMQTQASGAVIMFAYISDRNIRSMLTGTVLAFLAISASLAIALKSVRLGLISIIPNLVPAGIAFGIWGMSVGVVGLAASVITATSLGLIVDATVHIMSKYNRARKEHGYDAADAIRYSFSTVGLALWVATAILVAGFAVLALSGFRLNWEMGLLTALAIAAAIVVDFLLLPPLLMLFDRSRKTNDSAARAEPVPAE
ncbi:efflux RND transporter permease subunit [Aestuariispira insulae]|uniref:SSD domain-containing protein n=1 Tax=Aestuariispira insulae TaxID=1461337 RepID=A0A3D9HF97_9PROT|nr:MMPL family transporter [Aestuariispira insulae]RED48153.1 hypothetical protein DFP90_108172 [Aestuariispira insulae]